MKKALFTKSLIILSLSILSARSPTRPSYYVFERDMTKLEFPFSEKNLDRIKDARIVKAKLSISDSIYSEYEFDTLGRITDISYISSGYPMSETMINYLGDTHLPVSKIAGDEDYAVYYTAYEYNSENRLIGFIETCTYLSDKTTDTLTNLKLLEITDNQTVLSNEFRDEIVGYYYLDADNLITKKEGGYLDNDSISIVQINEQNEVVEYWYKTFNKYHLGAKRFYKQDTLIREKSYYLIMHERDSLKTPSLKEDTHFYYDKNGLLIKEDMKHEEILYSYSMYSPLPKLSIYLKNNVIQSTIKYEYFRKPKKEYQWPLRHHISLLAWNDKLEMIDDTLSKIDSISWEILNMCSEITCRASKKKRNLKKALDWANASLLIEEHPKNLHAKANCYYYLRKQKKAIHYIDKAIALAKEMDEETTKYESAKRFYIDYKPPKW